MAESTSHKRLGRLESLRGAASLYVFAHHYVHVILTHDHPTFARFFKFGQLAVMVFFMVSGFVIYYSTVTRDFVLRDYLIRRFRRIYPPFLLALVITYVVQCLIVGGPADPEWWRLLGNLVMLQDENADRWVAPYLTNNSLWSLSYEWAFYLLFIPLFTKVRAERRLLAVAGLAVTAFGVHQLYPNQICLFLMYLPIWWAGVELAREYLDHGQVTLRRQLAPLGVIALLGGLWMTNVYAAWISGADLVMWLHPIIETRHFLTSVFILIVAHTWHAIGWRAFAWTIGPFERVAPISYGLYIVHKPFIHLAAERPLFGNPWAELLWVLPISLGLGWVVERGIHRYVVRWLPVGSDRQ